MYYLYKKGVYGHGVFWIGGELEEGKLEADKAASLDCDDYHEWQLKKYRETKYDDEYKSTEAGDEIVHIGKRKVDINNDMDT